MVCRSGVSVVGRTHCRDRWPAQPQKKRAITRQTNSLVPGNGRILLVDCLFNKRENICISKQIRYQQNQKNQHGQTNDITNDTTRR